MQCITRISYDTLDYILTEITDVAKD